MKEGHRMAFDPYAAAKAAAKKYYEDKNKGKYGTTSNSTVQKQTAAQQAAQRYQQQKNSGIYKTTSGGTVSSKSGGSSGGARTISSVTIPAIKTPNIPTKKYNPVRPTPSKDVSGIDQSQIAAAAYQRQLAKYRNSNDDEEDTKPDIEIVAGAQEKTPKYYNGYGRWMLPSENYAANPSAVDGSAQAAANANPYGTRYGTTLRRTQSNPNSSETFGLALDPNYEYKTYAQQQAEKAAAEAERERAYQQWLAQQQTIAQPVVEEEMLPEEELDPMEDYWQAIIDAQNAQYAALNQALRNQQSGLNSLYDQNAADLYAQYVRSGLVLPEQMAGMATGTADSMMLQNDLNYQNNLNKNELERIAGLADIDAQMAQNQADADLQAAQTAAEWAKMAYQQRLAEQEAEREYQLALAKANQSNSSSKPSLTASQAMSAWENGYDTPEIRAALQYYYGYVPENKNASTKPSGANSVSAQSADLGAGLANGSSGFGIVDTKAYYVPGLGRLSGAEVKKGIQSGQIDVYTQGSDYFFRKA